MSGRITVFSRRQDLRGLGHEADAAKSDDVGVGRRGLARQIEAVADEVGEVLDFRLLVIMGEDDGVALALQPLDLGEEVEPLQALRLDRHFVPSRRACARPPGWLPYMASKVEIGRIVGVLVSRKSRNDLHVVESRGASAASRSPLNRLAGCLAGKPHRNFGLRLLAQVGDGARARLVASSASRVGQSRQAHRPRHILALRQIDVRPGNFEIRNAYAQGLRRGPSARPRAGN